MYEYQEKEKQNRTGIPDGMKKDFETRSGVSLDHVRLVRNSPLPERYGALAFSKGDSIYIKSGEERHLAHEVVHQIQAAQGMVAADEVIDGEAFNRNPVLEDEADRGIVHAKPPVMQRKQETIQRKIGMEFQTYGGEWNIKKLRVPAGKTPEARKREFAACVSKGDGSEERMLVSAGRDIISDFSGTKGYQVTADGPDLEYVTNAFDERTEKDRLINAVTQAAQQHEQFLGMTDGQQVIEEKYRLINGAGGIYCINKDGEKTAHPQATVGVKYEKIPALIERMITEPSGSVFYQEGDRPRKLRENLKTGRDSVESDLRLHSRGIPDPDRCKAWIQLAEEYLIAANSRFEKDEQKKRKETDAMNEFFAAVSEKLSAAQNLTAFPDWASAAGNFDNETARMNTVADVGEMFSVEQADIRRLKTKFQHISKDYKVFCRKSGEIERQEKRLAAEQGKEKQNSKNIAQIVRNIQKKREELERLGNKLEQKWQPFQAEANTVIAAINDDYGRRAARLSELERKKIKLEEVKPEVHQSDMFAYLTWYYRKLETYVEEWPTLKKNPKIKNSWRKIKENTLSKPERYFKTLLPVKSRTSFYDLYVLLSEPGKRYVKEYITGKYSRDALIFEDYKNCISLGEWLDEMERPVAGLGPRRDIANYELENEVIGEEFDYMNYFRVSRSTDIGYDSSAAPVYGALLELRRLKGQIPASQWGGAAGAVADCVAEINREEETGGGPGGIGARRNPEGQAEPMPLIIQPGTASRNPGNSRTGGRVRTQVIRPPAAGGGGGVSGRSSQRAVPISRRSPLPNLPPVDHS